MDVQRYGPWALIVGGSEGVGAAFARKLAASGFKLVLVARKTGPLEELAQELRGQGTEVRTLSADLSKADAIDHVRTVTDDVEVGLLIYNAGANSVRAPFVTLDKSVYRAVIGVNVTGQTEFTHHYAGLMCERRRGGVILTGSLGGYVGHANLATYTGAKAFSRIFSEAVWFECQPFGVDVLHLNLGLTNTPAVTRLGIDVATADGAEDVAQEGLDNIANGPVWITGGQPNIDKAWASVSTLPRSEAVRAAVLPPRD